MSQHGKHGKTSLSRQEVRDQFEHLQRERRAEEAERLRAPRTEQITEVGA